MWIRLKLRVFAKQDSCHNLGLCSKSNSNAQKKQNKDSWKERADITSGPTCCCRNSSAGNERTEG